ncbi:MAG: hypothetical protein IPL61_18350 [Myxococcales bacterium]|nr:hypothetical protein [Myxococcales bacterium]
MGSFKHTLLWFVSCTAAAGCALDEGDVETGAAAGIWDRNGPWWNHYADRDGHSASYAPSGVWRNAVSGLSDFAIRLDASASACGAGPGGATGAPVGNIADGGRIIGADLEIVDGAART